jgi:hypothetical protein
MSRTALYKISLCFTEKGDMYNACGGGGLLPSNKCKIMTKLTQWRWRMCGTDTYAGCVCV